MVGKENVSDMCTIPVQLRHRQDENNRSIPLWEAAAACVGSQPYQCVKRMLWLNTLGQKRMEISRKEKKKRKCKHGTQCTTTTTMVEKHADTHAKKKTTTNK